MKRYRLFQWKDDGLEQLGQVDDQDDEIEPGAEIRLSMDVDIHFKVLEVLEPNPRKIKNPDGSIYEPEPIAIMEEQKT